MRLVVDVALARVGEEHCLFELVVGKGSFCEPRVLGGGLVGDRGLRNVASGGDNWRFGGHFCAFYDHRIRFLFTAAADNDDEEEKDTGTDDGIDPPR